MLSMNKWWISIYIILIVLLCGGNVLAATEQPVSFMQTDSQWGSEPYSITNNRSQTIATSGCGPTSMAMVLNYYVDSEITPLQTAEYALENNHRTRNQGTSWGYFEDVAKEYDLEFFQTSSSKEALEWMENRDDALIICSMRRGLWTSGGHYILLWNVEDGIAYINDPNSTKKSHIENSYSYMASQCRQYFCFNKTSMNGFSFYLFDVFNSPILYSSILQSKNTISVSSMTSIDHSLYSHFPVLSGDSLLFYNHIS